MAVQSTHCLGTWKQANGREQYRRECCKSEQLKRREGLPAVRAGFRGACPGRALLFPKAPAAPHPRLRPERNKPFSSARKRTGPAGEIPRIVLQGRWPHALNEPHRLQWCEARPSELWLPAQCCTVGAALHSHYTCFLASISSKQAHIFCNNTRLIC